MRMVLRFRSLIVASVILSTGVLFVGCTKKSQPTEDKVATPVEEQQTPESKGKNMNLPEGNTAVLETSMGTITFDLLPKLAPGTVENFKKLASSDFYRGTTFHRVIPDFMIQGGDPNSKNPDKSTHGIGGPGYSIKAEFSNEKHVRGIVSMARSADPDSAGSQFFIVVKDAPHLDNQYTVFGKVTDGMDVVDKIVSAPRDSRDNPNERIEIKSVTIK